MEQNGKQVHLYRGIWFALISIIAVPVGIFFLLFAVINRYFDHPMVIKIDISLGFGGAIGCFYIITLFFAGHADDLLRAIGDRVTETREFYGGIFNKDGLKWYFSKFVEDGGIILWTLVLFALIYAGISVYGFYNFYIWYIAK